jgi:hypothetical protein
MNTSYVQNGKWRRMILTAALLAWLAPGATQALAAAVGGNDTNINMPVAACTTLNAQNVIVPAGTVQYCAVTGSADVQNSGSTGLSTYLFNLTLDNVACLPLDGGKERTVQFRNLAFANPPLSVPDVRIKEVSSTGFFRLGPGAHTLRWTARPLPGSPATAVLDRSMSVVCDNIPLPPTPIPLP